MNEHSPLPWHTIRGSVHEPDERWIFAASGSAVDHDDKANADLIVRAVNSHAELVAACKEALRAMYDEWLYQTGQFCRPAENYPPQGSVHGGMHNAIGLIRSALAKAGELCD